jgi:hypothetical protein
LIRKEHVRCRYGVFKVRANSRRAHLLRSPLHRHLPAHRSLKTQQRTGSRPHRNENVCVGDEVDIHLGEL